MKKKNDYTYFSEYYLGIILSAYKDFSDRVEYITNKKMNAKDRVASIIKNHIGKITKQEIVERCPDISIGTIERVLKELLDANIILKISGGRFTSYTYNNKK